MIVRIVIGWWAFCVVFGGGVLLAVRRRDRHRRDRVAPWDRSDS